MFFYQAPFQPGRLRGAMRREMEKGIGRPGQPDLFRIVELDLPTGTRYLSDSTPAETPARAKPKILNWGSHTEGFDLRTYTLEESQWTFTIADTDRDFAIEMAKRGSSLRNSAVRLKRGSSSPEVAELDWYTEYAGVLKDWQPGPEDRSWSLRVGPNDDALQNGFMPDVAVTKAVFPNAHDRALGQYPATIYGVHSSQGFSAQGFITCLYIDTVGFVYLVGRGKLSVPRVFKDGAQQSSGFSITSPIYAGRLYTCVDFTSSQGESTITVDCEGLTDNPAGGGTLIANPADVFKHFITNFGFNQWPGYGPYYAPSASLFDLRFFAVARDFFADHSGSDNSKWISGSEPVKTLDLINEWATSNKCKVFRTNEGKLAIWVPNYRPRLDPYSTEQWIRERDVGSAFRPTFDAAAIISKISLQTTFGQAAGRFYNELLVTDLSAGVDFTESHQAPWSKAAVS